MASPSANSVDLPIPTFGGRVSQYDAQTLPVGGSPFNQDIKYSGVDPTGKPVVAGVCTRDGMSPFYATPFAGNPTVNYLKTFVDSRAIYHLLSLDGLGNMRDENPCPIPPGVPSIIGTVVAASIAQSDALLNREWIAISTPITPGFGIDIPRQWNSQFFDRVSQVGPGEPPTIADLVINYPLEADPTGIVPYAGAITVDAISEVGGTVTLTLSVGIAATFGPYASTAVQIGDFINYADPFVHDYDGNHAITSILSDTQIQFELGVTGLANSSGGTLYWGVTSFTTDTLAITDKFHLFSQALVTGSDNAVYNMQWNVRGVTEGLTSTLIVGYAAVFNQGTSGGGTIGVGGNIGAGSHQVSVGFITRENYFTKPSPWTTWNAQGGLKATLSDIPIGPNPNIIARYLIFTPTIIPPGTTGPFFYFDGPVVVNPMLTYPSMVINDNTTTTYTVDFSDAVLENSTSATNLFSLLELGECSTVAAYSGRTFWCGERNKLPNMLNLTFDGGFSGGRPLGWSAVGGHSGSGGSSSPSPYYGGAYRITGSAAVGGNNNNGMITQGAVYDSLGVSIFNINIAYSVRVRLQKGGGTAAGNVILELYSDTAGSLGTFTVDQANITGKYTEFIGSIMPSRATLPPDTVFRIYTQALTVGGWVDFDCIEPYPTLYPYNNNIVRGSYALDPESFDQTTGFIQQQVLSNGYVCRALFTLLDNKLYIVNELGLFSTQDDGQNEPSLWNVNLISATMGTGSCRGVGVGESWAIIAHKTGAYIFWGSEPVKITQEIQPDWDRINWNADQTIYVVVDTANKRIHIGAPIDGATSPNVEFVCDYSQLANAEGQVSGQDIASHPQAYYSVYNPTKVVAPGKARKWTLWNLTMNCAALSIRSDGSYHLLRGNGTGTGKVYDQVYTQTSDDGIAINGEYQTAYTPQVEDEQALQLGSHRKMYKYLTGYATGSGSLSFTYFGANNQRAVSLVPYPLQSVSPWDFEKNTNFVAERGSLLFGTNKVGSWFHLTKLIPVIQRELITPIRGNN